MFCDFESRDTGPVRRRIFGIPFEARGKHIYSVGIGIKEVHPIVAAKPHQKPRATTPIQARLFWPNAQTPGEGNGRLGGPDATVSHANVEFGSRATVSSLQPVRWVRLDLSAGRAFEVRNLMFAQNELAEKRLCRRSANPARNSGQCRGQISHGLVPAAFISRVPDSTRWSTVSCRNVGIANASRLFARRGIVMVFSFRWLGGAVQRLLLEYAQLPGCTAASDAVLPGARIQYPWDRTTPILV